MSTSLFGGNKRNGQVRMFKARRYKRIWLHSKKGENFKGAEIWDAGWKVTGKEKSSGKS